MRRIFVMKRRCERASTTTLLRQNKYAFINAYSKRVNSVEKNYIIILQQKQGFFSRFPCVVVRTRVYVKRNRTSFVCKSE